MLAIFYIQYIQSRAFIVKGLKIKKFLAICQTEFKKTTLNTQSNLNPLIYLCSEVTIYTAAISLVTMEMPVSVIMLVH